MGLEVCSKHPPRQPADRFISDAVYGRLTVVLSGYHPADLETERNLEDGEHPLPEYSNDHLKHYIVQRVEQNCSWPADYDQGAINAHSFYSFKMLYYRTDRELAAQHRSPSLFRQRNRYDHRY